MFKAGRGLMAATLNEMQDWIEHQPDATQEERSLAFKFLMKNDAIDVVDMLGL